MKLKTKNSSLVYKRYKNSSESGQKTWEIAWKKLAKSIEIG